MFLVERLFRRLLGYREAEIRNLTLEEACDIAAMHMMEAQPEEHPVFSGACMTEEDGREVWQLQATTNGAWIMVRVLDHDGSVLSVSRNAR